MSPAFTFDTRDSNATAVATSPVFAIDTRAVDGLQGAAVSGSFAFDTRSLGLPTLVVSGAPHITPGASQQYTCVAYYAGRPPEDVTNSAAWNIEGAPPGTSIPRGRVTLGKGRGGVARITASLWRQGGQRTSTPLAVTVGPNLRVVIAEPVVTPLNRSGQDFQWRVQATVITTPVGPGATYAWYWKNSAIPGQGGFFLDTTIPSRAGSGELTVIVTDPASGASGLGYYKLVFDKPPVGNEGVPQQTSGDAEEGLYWDDQDQPFVFDGDRANVGLIVVTHGMQLDDNPQNQRAWLKSMAQKLNEKIAERSGAANLPNVVIYDWLHDANSRDLSDEEADELVVKTIQAAGLELYGPTVTEKAQGFYKSLLNQERFNPNLALAYGGFSNAFGSFKSIARDFLANAIPTRVRGQSHGQFLGARLLERAVLGEINEQKPIHLIGHSAGGFVVGECAKTLKAGGYDGPILVTMLDTPLPFAAHRADPSRGLRVERYLSSILSRGSLAPTWDGNSRAITPGFPFPSSQPVWKIPPDCDYHRFEIADDTYAGWVDDHSRAHEWYFETIDGTIADNGFHHSPFGGNQPWACPPSPSAFAALHSAPQTIALGPMQSYGSVVASGGEYVITEVDNAGIYIETTLPVGASKLHFEYRFTAAGDGDFLQVFASEGVPLFVGGDNTVSRAGFVSAELDVSAFAGETIRLDLKLVSRGDPNAVLSIRNLQIETDDDLDGDGLSNATELANGTSPWLSDTDGDGFDDAYESLVSQTDPTAADSDGDGADDLAEFFAGTNPMDSHSVFAVTEFSRAGGGFLLRWSALSGKTYRILRSPTVDFASFDVIASDIAGVVPTATYNDTTISTVTSPAAFYRIEAE